MPKRNGLTKEQFTRLIGTTNIGCAHCTAISQPNGQPLLQCSGCNSVFYCCAEHQKIHWKEDHKKQCKKLRKERRKTRDEVVRPVWQKMGRLGKVVVNKDAMFNRAASKYSQGMQTVAMKQALALAEALQKQGREYLRSKNGNHDYDRIYQCYMMVGKSLLMTDDYEQILHYYALAEKFLTRFNPDLEFGHLIKKQKIIQLTMIDVGHILTKIPGRFQEGVALMEKAIRLLPPLSRKMGNKIPDDSWKSAAQLVPSAARNIGLAYMDLHDPLSALEWHQRALAQYAELFGENHFWTGMAHLELASCLSKYPNADNNETLKSLFKAEEIFKATRGKSFEHLPQLYYHVGKTYVVMGRKDEAKEYFEKIVEMEDDRHFRKYHGTSKIMGFVQSSKQMLQCIEDGMEVAFLDSYRV